MNTPNNRRRRESVERIEMAFMQLLEGRQLGQIRVSEICKLAQINRSTFYANFEDVYTLADALRDKLEQEFFQQYQEMDAGDYDTGYLKLFRHIRANQEAYKTYFKLGYDRQLKLTALDNELTRLHFQNRFVNYHMEFFKSGLTRVIELWLEGGCAENPEEMVEIIQSEYRGRGEFGQE